MKKKKNRKNQKIHKKFRLKAWQIKKKHIPNTFQYLKNTICVFRTKRKQNYYKYLKQTRTTTKTKAKLKILFDKKKYANKLLPLSENFDG